MLRDAVLTSFEYDIRVIAIHEDSDITDPLRKQVAWPVYTSAVFEIGGFWLHPDGFQEPISSPTTIQLRSRRFRPGRFRVTTEPVNKYNADGKELVQLSIPTLAGGRNSATTSPFPQYKMVNPSDLTKTGGAPEISLADGPEMDSA